MAQQGGTFLFVPPLFTREPDTYFALGFALLLGVLTFFTLLVAATRRSASPSGAILVMGVVAVCCFAGGSSMLPASRSTDIHWLATQLTSPGHFPQVLLYLVGLSWLFGITPPGIAIGLISLENRRLLSGLARQRAIRSLLLALQALLDDEALGKESSRRIAVSELEDAARYVRLGLPKTLPLQDASQRDEFRRRCTRAGNHLQSMALWVALPRADTAHYLREAITGHLVTLLRGTYDDLPGIDPPHVTSEQVARHIWRVVRTIMVGAVPLACLLGFKLAGLQIRGPLGDGFTIVCIIWTAGTYMSLLDPLFDSRLTAVRDALATIRGITEKK